MKNLQSFNEKVNKHRVNDDYHYSIFEVYAYKGGELSSQVNLSRLDVCYTIIEYFFQDNVLKLDQHEDDVKKQMNKITKDRISTYAFDEYGYFCGEVYRVENNKLVKLEIPSFYDDIIDILTWDNI